MTPDAAPSLNRHESLRFRAALLSDTEALARLINAAFVVEHSIFGGDRTSPDGVRAYMEKGKFLLAEDSNGLAGCVYVELRGDRGYIGLLSVEPQRQGLGLGRKLMDSAEKFFRQSGCAAVDLRVVSARTPLPAFYRHLGYVESHTAPVPSEPQPRVPCHFIYMSKRLT
jgi:ribosomal protein S18 acetylase RimI-like enzyme